MKSDAIIREQLRALLRGGNAHMSFDEVIEKFPLGKINAKLPNFNYTPWHLLEHMRIVQWDILEFIQNPEHVSPDYPSGYWPPEESTATAAQWKKTITAFSAGLKSAQGLVKNSHTDFFSPIPHAKDYTVFREMLLIADHNAYHIGEIATMRQVMNIRPASGW